MKAMLSVTTLVVVLCLAAGAVLAQSGNELFSQALLKERTEGNLIEAINLYQTIVDKYSKDRNLVANALLQIGLCYEKLGKTDEARKAFDRIVREYRDHKARANAIAHLEGLNRDRSEGFGAIRGHVTEKGRPIGARVFALKAGYNDGLRLMTPVLTTWTNEDSGEYNLSPLLPGKYYIAAAVPARSNDGRSGYLVPAFFPDTPDPERAKLVEVRPGSTISNLNIAAGPVSLRRVRGTVTGIGPFRGPEDPVRGGPLSVTIMRQSRHDFPTALMFGPQSARVAPNGTFEVPGVPGTFELSVHQNFANGGHVSIEVGDHDIEGVNIGMVPGLRISGRIVMEQPTAAVPTLGSGSLFRVYLRSDPPLRGSINHGATMADNGFFSFPGSSRPLQRGNYRVSVLPILSPPAPPGDPVPGNVGASTTRLPTRTYVKSIRLGDADVLNDGLHLQDQPRQELVIVIGANPGSLEGRIVNAQRQPIRQATVVLIPEGGIRFRIDHRFTSTDASGRFSLQLVPPGDYKVFAWQGVEKGAWQDPDFVRPYESRGKLIHIKEGDRQVNVEVMAIPPKP